MTQESPLKGPPVPHRPQISSIPVLSARGGRSRWSGRLLPIGALGVAGVFGLASCADPESSPQQASEEEPVATDLSVVASTDVYADLASTITGDTAEVTAIVDNPAIDPHSYEATPQDRIAVEQADVLIAIGGGYDPFLSSLAEAAQREDALLSVLSAEGGDDDAHDHGDEDDHDHAEDEGHDDEADGHDDHAGHDHGDENEHVWYDLAMMSEFVHELAERLGQESPENAELYTENAENLSEDIEALDERNRSLDAEGVTYTSTEAVSAYLLDDAGFEDQTDPDFLSAVEHGDDVSVRLFQQALETAEGVDLLVYNEQTETNQSLQIREAAEDADVPVLMFSETLPDEHDDYLSWMSDNIDRLEQLLSSD